MKNPLHFVTFLLMPLIIVGLTTAIIFYAPQKKDLGFLQGQIHFNIVCIKAPCEPAPEEYEAREVLAYKSDSKIIFGRVHPDASGFYRLPLAEGKYRIELAAYGSDAAPGLPKEVSIARNKTTTLNIDIGTANIKD